MRDTLAALDALRAIAALSWSPATRAAIAAAIFDAKAVPALPVGEPSPRVLAEIRARAKQLDMALACFVAEGRS